MEVRISSRPQPSVPSQSSESTRDLNGNHDCSCGSCTKVGGAAVVPQAATSEESRVFRKLWVVIACLSIPTLVFVSGAYRPPLAFVSGFRQRHQDFAEDASGDGAEPVLGYSNLHQGSQLPGGLLAAGFGGESCLSRHESPMYRKPAPHRPTPDLVDRLRRYEALHRRCAPHTAAYNQTLRLMTEASGLAGTPPQSSENCMYLVWTPENGMGNRMIGLASAFLYALLTGRVLLIDRSQDMAGLFCEPFPAATWLLPLDFPVGEHFYAFNQKHPRSYGNMLRKGMVDLPAFVYVHLSNDYDDHDKRFFCKPDQLLLGGVPWLMLRSDMYFAPGLFAYPAFRRELDRLFPEKEAVFHLLCRYLFHPSDAVWGLITRYYRAYLATADERIGIQVRVFGDKNSTPFELVLHQILNCTLTEKVLPQVDLQRRATPASASPRGYSSKALLLTSLESGYYERIKDMYWGHPAAGGVVISVHQPSHEEVQQTERAAHDEKALAEIYLLSLSDVLVTSAWSTFGYVAQAIGGLKPWILLKPGNGRMPEPACVRAMSMEPCYDFPPNYDCKARNSTEMRKMVPFLRQCEDLPWGLKMVEGDEG